MDIQEVELFRQDDQERGRVWIDDQYGDRVAKMDVSMHGPIECLQLAQLFVAAPALLREIVSLVRSLEHVNNGTDRCFVELDSAKEAIALAYRGSPGG